MTQQEVIDEIKRSGCAQGRRRLSDGHEVGILQQGSRRPEIVIANADERRPGAFWIVLVL